MTSSMVILALLLLNLLFYFGQKNPLVQALAFLFVYLILFWMTAQLYLYPILVGMKEPSVLGALRMAAALWRFWQIRAHMSEGRQVLAELLEPGLAARKQDILAAIDEIDAKLNAFHAKRLAEAEAKTTLPNIPSAQDVAAVDKATAALQKEADTLKAAVDPLFVYESALKRIDDLKKAGLITEEQVDLVVETLRGLLREQLAAQRSDDDVKHAQAEIEARPRRRPCWTGITAWGR